VPGAPRVRLDHLRLLTDDTGLIQHAAHSVPRRESGYATDDNARALVLTARASRGRLAADAAALAPIYLAYLAHAQRPDGLFHNFMSYERTWLDEAGSEDCQGRAAWACAEVLAGNLPTGLKRMARELLDRLRPRLSALTSARGAALTLIAVGREPPDRRAEDRGLALAAAQRLHHLYAACRHHDWHWFEPVLTYANARLPEAMIAAHDMFGESDDLEIALESLAFLTDVTFRDGVFVPIGNRRWYERGRWRSEFDQQPIEAACTASALMAAWRATGLRRHRAEARRALDWFHGRNALHTNVADPARGACHDGIGADGVNTNEGAESTVLYLLALQDYARR